MAAVIVAGGSPLLLVASDARADACPANVMDALRAPAGKEAKPVNIRCDVSLNKGDRITQRIVFSGSRSSGVVFDCNGAMIDGSGTKARTVLIQSRKGDDGKWDVPTDITIRNCQIKGDLRIQGLGNNGQAKEVKASSNRDGHTQRAQAAAPTGILLDNLTFSGSVGVPLYLAPGVTNVTVQNSRFTGKASSTVVYLDAESAGNVIVGNTFSARPEWREVIAVDGSANNRIENNTFVNPLSGGVYLYRNCGEGGTFRHQSPQGNLVRGNTFQYQVPVARPAVWIGSREGLSMFNSYCLVQPKMLLEGLDHSDGANNNTVTDNRLIGGSPNLIVDEGAGNRVSNNR
ncbi:right-handed parallel beta-helix repeat-containing protein [Rhizobium wenxiniae]|uniref:right-handed parallel beta-helix repeat-containing protein n=1 Tax=Rhizobium wenxiniae TaxID=1737357 RepID=UPI0031FDCBC1